MKKRVLSGVLCALLMTSVLMPAALAAEEAPVEELPLAEELLMEELPEESALSEESALPVEEPLSGEEPAEEVLSEEPVPSGEPEEEEPEEEGPVEAAAPGDELPMADEADLPEGDPDDPLYWKYRELAGLDGAYGSTWSAFKPRALNSGETLRKGIDVSAWQGTINWTKVAQAGVEFVFIRGAYRGVSTGRIATDGRFTDYIRGAKAAGLKVGVYIFSQAITVKEAEEEAQYLLNLVKGYSIDLPLVFDLEHYTGGRFTNADLSKSDVTKLCLAFCRKIESAGYVSMVYSNPSMLNHDMNSDEIGRLWLANFTTQTQYTGHAYEYWQCSDIGQVSGIDAYVDLDFWFQPNTGPFTDVKIGDWFRETVLQAYEKGIVNGVTKTTFDPSGTATRGQVITMIHRLAGEPAWTMMAPFTDLDMDYYKDAVYWSAETGISTGYNGTQFRPERSITREELVTILYRMAGEPKTTATLDDYSDGASVQSYARAAMAWAVSNKIVTGYEDGTLRPRANATRAEVCTILMRYDAL